MNRPCDNGNGRGNGERRSRTKTERTPVVRATLMAGMALLVAEPALAGLPALGGCPMFPADNIWNTAVDTLPVDANSSLYVATIGAGNSVHPDFGTVYAGAPNGIPYVTVPGTQPAVPITFTYWDESDPGPYPIPPNAPIEGGPTSTGDRHVLIVDVDHCNLYEIYDARPQPDGSWKGGSGATWSLASDALRPATWTSADAAGLPMLPGLVRYDEVASGEIAHALRFTAPATRNTYVWPARHKASSNTDVAYPPMGQRFRLKQDYDISGYSAANQVILRALKKYGMMLADNGSAWYISGAPDPRWNDDDLHALGQVPGSAFEAVDVTSLIVDVDSGKAVPPAPPPPLPAPPAGATYDVDGDGRYDALTDGLLMLRWMFGLRGTALVNGVTGSGATRTSAQIETYLGTLGAALDVDDNHVADALTDGIVILRRLFGLGGTPLIGGALGTNAARTTPSAIAAYIDGFTPAAP
jgi:hypothetical protein